MSGLYVPDIDPDADTLTAALEYAKAGWYVGPIRHDTSEPKHAGNVLGNDWPAKTSKDPKTIISWFAGRSLGLYLHVGRSGAWAADVDQPEHLPEVLRNAIPQVPYQASRVDQPERGHYLFATPPGRILGNSVGAIGKGGLKWGEARGLNGIIVVWPTPRHDGGRYRWVRTGLLPVLPESVASLLPDSGPGERAVDDATLSAFLLAYDRADRPQLFKAVTNHYRAEIETGGSRHEAGRNAACWAMREAAMGFYSAQAAAQELRELYVADRAQARDGGRGAVREDTARSEFHGLLAWAIGQVDLDELPRRRKEIEKRLPDRNDFSLLVSDEPLADGDEQRDDIRAFKFPDGQRPTDVGNSARLLSHAEGRLRYVHAWGKWIVYVGGRWIIDENDALVTEKAKRVAKGLLRLAAKVGNKDSDTAKPIWEWALKSETSGAIAAMVRLARGAPGILVEHEQLDADPYLLNAHNGTINLSTGVLRPHDPDDLCTLQCPVAYDPDARAPLWEACIERWQPDPAVRHYVQLRAGAGATGKPTETVDVDYGGGGNGKSKFWGAIQHVLGDYTVVPHKSLLVAQRHEQHATVVARLFRKRLAVASETKSADVLDDEQVKNLTGGDRLSGRRMREDPWEFQPSHTLVMFSNHKPAVQGRDEGIWRRLRLVPWEVTIPEDERDDDLADKLKAEAPGILAWVVAGAHRFLAEGLAPPDAVRVATDAYRAAEDTVGQFIADVLCIGDGWAYSADIKAELDAWCDERGVSTPPRMNEVVEVLKSYGCRDGGRRSVHGKRSTIWHGVRVAEIKAEAL